ncbi:MAG: hypothetical protein QGG42_10260 [Phycisphaerae bacterium]|jgi:hypothetical protein|nr:hypothetical protein [Phycisphaerae bacterium]
MRLTRTICLIALIASGPRLWAQESANKLQAKLTAALIENETLKKLLVEHSALNQQLSADLVAQRRAVEEIRKEIARTNAQHKSRAMEYRLALAENKMLKARVKSLLRSTGSSTSKPGTAASTRRNVRLIAITLHEELWKWWSDPLLLSEHIALRRKLVHLDVDHGIDAWLTRRKEFAGTRVNWSMKLMSGSIISKDQVNKALKKANRTLDETLRAAVYGQPRPKKPNNTKIVDGRLAARATTRPARKPPAGSGGIKAPKTTGYDRPKRVDFRKQIRQLQEQIDLYKRSSTAGGMTTIYAVAGDIVVKMSLPGRRFENVSAKNRPAVQVTGDILSAGPKAGYFIGRKDTMIQFILSGECKLKNPPPAKPKPE